MNDSLKILITAGLNMGASIKSVNESLKILSKHPSLQKLDLKINVDQSFVKSIQGFIDATKKLNVSLEQQNRVVKETQDVYKNLDGTVKQVTQQVLKNGEVIEKTKTVHDANKNAVNAESKSLQDQIRTLKQLEKELEGYTLAKTRANKNKLGETNSTTNTYKNDSGQQISVKLDQQGNIKNYSEINEILKQQQAALKSAETMDRAHYDALKSNKQRIEAMDKLHYQALQRNREIDRRSQEQSLKAAESLDRAHYQALKSNSERQIAQEKQHALALQQNTKRDQQYAQSVANTQQKINDARSKFSGNAQAQNSLTELENKLKSIRNIGDFKSPLGNLNNDLKRTVQGFNEASKSSETFGSSIQGILKSMIMWSAVTAAIYAPINAFKEGIQHIYELDKAMTDLKKVTDETNEMYQQVILNSSKTANEIGGLTLDVINSTTEWARLGYTIQQSQQLAKQTLVYQNVGDISNAQEASKQLISSIKGFGIEVDNEGKNIQHVVDVYNEVGNKFAISTEGIGQAVQRSASSLSSAGNTIEQSVALITAANSTVQDPAKVGNALKTLSMRLRGVGEDGEAIDGLVPKLEKKFQSLGLTLKKDDKTFKSTYEIFDDLSKIWKNLSDIQQADVLELVAGKMQGNIAASMISNWKDAQASLEAGINSFGSASKENETYLASLEGRIHTFTNAASAFWEHSISASFLKGVVDLGTTLINVLGKVSSTIGFLPTVVGAATLAFMLFSKTGLTPLYTLLTTIPLKLNLFKLELRSLIATNGLASASLKILGTSFAALGRTIAPLAIITGVTWALTELFSWITKSNEAAREARTINYDTVNSYREQKKSIEDLSQEMSTLQEAESNQTINTDQKKRLLEIQVMLVEQYGVAANKINAEGKAYTDSVDAINTRTEALQKQIEAENSLNRSKLAGQDNESTTKIKDSKEEVDEYQKKIDTTKKQIELLKKDLESGKLSPDTKINTSDILKKYGDLATSDSIFGKDLDQLQYSAKGLLEQYNRTDAELQGKMSESNGKLYEALSGRIKVLQDSTTQYISELTDKGKTVSDSQRAFVQEMVKSIAGNSSSLNVQENQIRQVVDSLNNSNIEGLIQKYQKLSDAFKLDPSTQNNNEILKVRNDISALLETVTNGVPMFGDYKESVMAMFPAFSMADVAAQQFAKTSGQIESLQKSLQSAYKDTSSEIKDLNKVMADISKGNALNADQVAELIVKYPSLAGHIKKVADGWTIEKSAIQALQKAKITETKYTLEQEKTKTTQLLQATLNRLKIYDIEVNALDKIANKQKAIDELNSKKIPTSDGMNVKAPSILPGLNPIMDGYLPKLAQEHNKLIDDTKSQVETVSDLYKQLNDLGKLFDDPNYGVSTESKKKNDQYNDSMSQTNEILTETQKKLKAVEAAQDALNSKKSRLKKGSEEYGKALKEEIKLLEKQAALLTEGIKDPSKLVSTKVTTTTKGGTGLDSMISEALSLSSSKTFKYSQAAKSNVSYDQFTATAVSDCSLFVQQMFKEFLDIKLPRTTQEQVKQGQAVTNKKDLQKGDLVFFNTVKGKANSHVGVYMGDGNFMQMGNSGLKQGNLNDKYWADKYSGARRIPGANAIPEVQPPSTSTSTKVTGKNADLINKYAGANGVDPALIKAIIQQESSNGANGIKNVMQVSSLGKNTSVESSIKTGTSMFAKYLNQTGNVDVALAMYNMGPGILDYFNKNGGYSVENMKKFSAMQKSKTGSKVYGDVNYVGNVLRYYDGDTSSVSGGKTKNKYTLPSASDMDKAQADAREQRTTTYDNIYKARIDYIDNYVTISQNKLDALDADIAKSQGRQAKYDQVSANWRKEESSQIKSLTAQQKELVAQNINLDNLVKQNKITSGEFDKQKASNSSKWWEIEQQKQEKYYAVIVSNLDEYEKKIDAAADKIALSKARMESLDENSKEYQKELVTQIGLINEQRVATEKEILAVERQLKNEKLSLQNKEELSKRLQDLTLKNLEYNNAIYSIKSDAADKIIEAYKKMVEKQKDIALKAIDKQKDAEDKRHEQVVSNLDDEEKRFEDMINARLKALGRNNEADDYETELKKKLDERQKLQDRFNKELLDNSFEAKARRKDLQEQIDAKNEEIDKFKLDRERELRQENLQDQLEDRKKYLDKSKDAEDKTHDAITDNIEREKELTEQKYDDILEDEQRYYKMKQNLMSDDKSKVKSVIDELKGEYSNFFTFLQDQSLETSKQLQNMLDSISMDQSKLDDFLNLDSGIGNGSSVGIGDGNSTGNGKDNSNQKADWSKYLSNKQQAENISKQVVQLQREKKPDANKIKSLQAQFQSLKQQNDDMRSKWGFPDGSYDYLKGIKPFSAKTGGKTPDNMGGKGMFLLAHEKELVLNQNDTSNMLKLVDITRGIIDKIKGGFDFAKVSPISNSNKSDTTTITNYLNIDMSSSGNAQTDRKSIKTLIEGFERNGVTLRVT
ncbi:TP901 family phage tail tape measure protein [Paenibacillus peoriae]|uniref:TP901 family phage tail tape measure protein n=1 Tax=Paenibacillus peoriae TaxID=59893 RepID=A0ABU1QI64_9BACL|nr:phage tail tape measure protein [Paenibacillus peoriae]MDR6779333.1 TP901 family phage tail tape measure protein [Paenibacillus peoriae]